MGIPATSEFGELLRAVQERVRPLGVAEHVDAVQWLEASTELPRAEVVAGLASLLARSADEWRQIIALAGGGGDEKPIPAPVPIAPAPDVRRSVASSQRRRRGRLLTLAFGLAIVASVFLSVWLRPAPPAPAVPPDLPVMEPLPVVATEPSPADVAAPVEEEATVVATQVEPSKTVSYRWLPTPNPTILISVLLTLVCLFGFVWLFGASERIRQRRQKQLRATEQRSLARRKAWEEEACERGERPTSLALGGCFRPLSSQNERAVGELLCALRHRQVGRRLDMSRTILRTIAAGGRIVPVFEELRSPSGLVVLVDVGEHPWQQVCEVVVAGWKAQGVALRRYNVMGSLGWVHEADGAVVPLDDLARRTRFMALVIFSPRIAPLEDRTPSPWLESLRLWERRVWIDPCPLDDASGRPPSRAARRRSAGIALLAERGLPRFPLSEEGVTAAARHLAGQFVPPPREPLIAPLGIDPEPYFKRWAYAAVRVPEPNWRTLEALRPHVCESLGISFVRTSYHGLAGLVHWLANQPESRYLDLVTGEGVVIPPALAHRLSEDFVAACAEEPSLVVLGRVVDKRIIETLGQQGADATRPLGGWLRRVVCAFPRVRVEPNRAAELLTRPGVEAGPILGEGNPYFVEAREVAERALQMQDLAENSGHPCPDGEWSLDDRDAVSELVEERPRSLTLAQLFESLPERFGLGATSLAIVAAFGVWAVLTWAGGSSRWGMFGVTGEMPAVQRVSEQRVRAATIYRPAMVSLPPGAFKKWGAWQVELWHPPWIGAHEVTQAEYRAVMGELPNCPAAEEPQAVGEELPVACVSYIDAAKYLIRLSEKEGYHPCFEELGDKVRSIPGNGYQFPSETDWEYAARAGGDSLIGSPEDDAEHCTFGNLGVPSGRIPRADCEDSYPGVAPVGRFKENAWGLYDMLGNVMEWTLAFNDARTIVRGGSWKASGNLRTAAVEPLDRRTVNIGFRPALPPYGGTCLP